MSSSPNIRAGFLCYDLTAASRSTLNRLAGSAGEQVEIVAYPLLSAQGSYDLKFSYRAFRNPGLFFSFNNARGDAPEIMWFGLPVRTVKHLVETSDVVCLLGIQGLSALAAYLYARARKKPVAVITQSMGPEAEKKRNALIRLAKRLIFAGASCIIAQTPPTIDTLKAVYAVGEQKIRFAMWDGAAQEFLPRIERQEHLAKAEMRREFNLQQSDYVITFCGTLIHLKGVDALVNSFHRVLARAPQARLLIIGANGKPVGTEETLRKMAADAGMQEQVSFLGALDWDRLAKAYLASDVFVLPTRKDIWPKVIVEAALAGLPVVTTEVCGAANSLVRDGVNGYIVAVDDEAQLAERLLRLAEPELRAAMGKASKALALEYLQLSQQEASVILQSIQEAAAQPARRRTQ